MEEAHPEADGVITEVTQILTDAGFEPMPEGPLEGALIKPDGRGGYVFGGVQRAIGEVHAWDAGLSKRTTNDPVEAALRLAAYVQGKLPSLSTEATLEPITLAEPEEPEETPRTYDEATAEYFAEHPEDESDGETGEEAAAGAWVPDDVAERSENDQDGREPNPGWDGVRLNSGDSIDADFDVADLGTEPEELEDDSVELPQIEGAEFEAEESDYFTRSPEPPQDRFIGLDDLDRRRSLRIGDVMRYANTLMPPWSDADFARLVSLRNFAMGVSEKRWDDNAANQLELSALETTLRRINEIKEARDQKVAFLEATDRAGVDGFVVEADWP